MSVIYDFLERRFNKRSGSSGQYELGSAILNNYTSFSDENVLTSSDVYKFMKDISDMIAVSEWTVEDLEGKDLKNSKEINVLNYPNNYLSGREFKKLMTNQYLMYGEVFVLKDGTDLHLPTNIISEIDSFGQRIYRASNVRLPTGSIAHAKNIGLSSSEGIGFIDLAKEMMEGVMNAEKSITDKYKKGGLLAYLLRLDAHLSPNNENQKTLVKKIQQKLDQIKNEGTTVIIPLSKGYNIEVMKSAVEDEKVLGFLNVYKKDVGKYMGFNPDAYQKLLETDLEKASIYLYKWISQPIIKNLEDHMTLLFFGRASKKKIKMKVDMMSYLTMSTKITNVSNLVRSMIATPDDGREIMDWDRLGTNLSTSLYVSKDLIGLDDLSDVTEAQKGGEET